MKRLSTLLLGIAFIILLAPSAVAQKNDGQLRILAIGNSFSDDGMDHLPALLESMDVENVELARLYVGGCSLQQHTEFHSKEQAAYMFYHSKAGENKWVLAEEKVTMQYALAMGEWDIITMQQVSGLSGEYESYHPYVDQLLDIVEQAQPNAHIVWHMTWAYSTDSNHNDFPRYDSNQQMMLAAITASTKQLIKDHKEFEAVIGSGAAIQSLRLSEINNSPKDLTRDGYHMDMGAGRYALACVWYETLIKPYTRLSMMGNTLRIDDGGVKVTDHTAPYCQKAAKQAAKNPFKVKAIKM